ncbi:hypothetical protein [Pedobacter jamesrossensis]|uniref:Class IIb bacteriocin, lactobin A/cerein 7B family n=1 Tax=Pedobacter jamesrossensis TaxID=1908238 RepID=A0ABV8NNF1_9SPHI
MKSLNLENFGVQEMDAKEMGEMKGGFLIYLYFIGGKAIYGAGMAVVAAGLKAAYDTGYDSIH